MWICPRCGEEDCDEHGILEYESWVCPDFGEEDCQEHDGLLLSAVDEFDDWLDYDEDL